VKRKILIRANYQCEHLGCTCSKNLQFAHITAYSKGGPNTENNLRLLCYNHHKFETFQEFGQILR
jgi:5-methylcytosine-specific restriction endonuclease McrA